MKNNSAVQLFSSEMMLWTTGDREFQGITQQKSADPIGRHPTKIYLIILLYAKATMRSLCGLACAHSRCVCEELLDR